MSRVGKAVIKIPAGVKVEMNGSVLSVSGTNGVLKQEIKDLISVEVTGSDLHVTRKNDENETKSLHGLYNRLIQNMIKGVTTGFITYLFCNGVGYKASQKPDGSLVLNLGLSHPSEVTAIPGIKFGILTPQEVQNLGFGKEVATVILRVQGNNKELVGAVAANIRALRPVEPYHLYGIRYSDEYVAKKESKSGAKKAK